MNSSKARLFVFRLVATTLISMGFVQVSGAGMIGTQTVIEHQARDSRIERIDAMLARDDVARQLVAFGADVATVKARVRNLTNAELAQLDGRIGQQTAGGDGLALIGAVFLVLLILELVGITDIFKRV